MRQRVLQVCLAMYAVAVELLHQDAYKHHCIVGYSGVIFGWMALLSARKRLAFTVLQDFFFIFITF